MCKRNREHSSDEEMFIKLKNSNYQQRLISFLLAMQKIFMSMPEHCIKIWNDTLNKIENKSESNEIIKLSRIGIVDNDISYLKIKLVSEQNNYV
ncbi:hypothetical protein [Staphylococcus cohnii]|uniref:hypothetical protein n=1 Tax=Staphylococcus cohnii TaxID=29382 RepID=UPI000D1AD1D9|nr:hypothetical protein [Staphylococcus cohnii]PTG43192.1 hypothetical protein BUY20_10515 [Staphylococcus cohnii]